MGAGQQVVAQAAVGTELAFARLFVWCLVVWGLAFALGQTRVTYWLRAWLAKSAATVWVTQMLECPMCVGFWLGLGLSLTGAFSPTADLVFNEAKYPPYRLVMSVADGFFALGFNALAWGLCFRMIYGTNDGGGTVGPGPDEQRNADAGQSESGKHDRGGRKAR